MSIDVCIKQKGLFKKTIPLDVIIGDELAFGINDGLRMVGDDQEGNMIFYNPNSIGRGFHISWDEEEKNELNLRLLNPTTTDEMRSFFNCLRRITDYWKCSFTVCFPEFWRKENGTYQKRISCGTGVGFMFCSSCFYSH